MDEHSGTRVDSHGSNDLTDVGSTGFATGKINDAAAFTFPFGERLEIADNTDISTGDIDFTLAAWIYPTQASDPMNIIAKWKFDDGNQEYAFYQGSFTSRFNFKVSSAGNNETNVTASSVALSNDTWYFAVMWHDSVNNEIAIQVNDGTVHTTSHSGGVFDSASKLVFGTGTLAEASFTGRIDSVSFWKRLLTSGERTSLYNGGAGLDYPFS